MDLPFLQSDIYDKFDALQERGAGRAQFWEIVARGVLMLLVAIAVYLLLSYVYRRFFWRADRRGRSTWDKGDLEGSLLEMGDDVRRSVLIGEIPKQASFYFFWEVGGLNCGCGGTIREVEGNAVKIDVGSDSAPVNGAARLVVPDLEGNVSFYDVKVAGADGDLRRTLETEDGRASAFMDRACRMRVNLKAAALVNPDDGETASERDGVLVRILDLSLDGLGLRSDVALESGAKILVRAQFPGYLEPITVNGTVAWSREELTGIHRAGVAISFSGLDLRLIVADFMYLTRRAERPEREPEPVEA